MIVGDSALLSCQTSQGYPAEDLRGASLPSGKEHQRLRIGAATRGCRPPTWRPSPASPASRRRRHRRGARLGRRAQGGLACRRKAPLDTLAPRDSSEDAAASRARGLNSRLTGILLEEAASGAGAGEVEAPAAAASVAPDGGPFVPARRAPDAPRAPNRLRQTLQHGPAPLRDLGAPPCALRVDPCVGDSAGPHEQERPEGEP
eukprot:CAMPEP_0177613682 /NCGR_PEP_ID=MMETSP0419_2-20121207/22154_1 /TAXON_ID=582737 /ORGANISM="Tetraselmis sp., Strain GSL018" /LENGTH=202 /DNA_ID=CAMNT_0019110493 /DNA_START=955 /DNA_END=1561 /DNA_ORIENTATION=+